MKTRTFNVPVDSIVEFAEIISEHELEGVIVGASDDEIEIKVEYEPEEQSQAILDMIEHIENLDGEFHEEDEDK
ncbi:MAG: hypothetical protein KAS32_09010 [Candidatus Peribacteraceae bacterium]|nr:hypothetical protein [Candidatus Peribacteraceae bacterium]